MQARTDARKPARMRACTSARKGFPLCPDNHACALHYMDAGARGVPHHSAARSATPPLTPALFIDRVPHRSAARSATLSLPMRRIMLCVWGSFHDVFRVVLHRALRRPLCRITRRVLHCMMDIACLVATARDFGSFARAVVRAVVCARPRVRVLHGEYALPSWNGRLPSFQVTILLRLKHPNIVNVREVALDRSMQKVYMVMDFAEHDLKGELACSGARARARMGACGRAVARVPRAQIARLLSKM